MRKISRLYEASYWSARSLTLCLPDAAHPAAYLSLASSMSSMVFFFWVKLQKECDICGKALESRM